jgi:hypothetical protein
MPSRRAPGKRDKETEVPAERDSVNLSRRSIGPAAALRPEDWHPAARPTASAPLNNEPRCPVGPSLRMHRGWAPTMALIIPFQPLIPYSIHESREQVRLSLFIREAT